MAERYKIYEQLGAGGVGAVYRAYDNELKRWVAIKRLMSVRELDNDEKLTADLRREADALAALRNPNIVTIFDVASDSEGLFMVMELLEGEDLADVVSRGPLHYDDFKELASQTLEALLAAHQRHILHRDIKPENIKVERLPGGRMQSKLIDFGLARAGLRARKQTEDQSGTVMGSIHYMAPEQLTRKPVDEKTDLYSLGCVFYEALSGRKAFEGETVAAVIDKHINHDLVPLHVIAPHVPPWLGAWVLRLMACRPQDRPVNAQQAIEEFRAWEKMSSAPQIMPWMPINYAPMPGAPYPQGVYPTGAVPAMGSPTTSSVPVYPMYYQTGQVQPVVQTAAQPVQSPPTVTAAVRPTAIAPPRAAAIGRPVRPPAPTAIKRGGEIRKYGLIGIAVLAGLILAFSFLGGDKSQKGAQTAAQKPATGSGGLQKVLFQLPTDRQFPPQDLDLVLHVVANVGQVKNGKDSTGRPISANVGEPVYEWHDLAPRGQANVFRALPGGAATAPLRQNWNHQNAKSGRSVLDFRPRDSKPAALLLGDAGKEVEQFPFGKAPVKGPRGLTLAAVFQADASRLPTCPLTLFSGDGSSVKLVVNKDKNLVAEFQNASGAKSSITSKDVDGTKPVAALLTWSADSGEVALRVRDGSDKAFNGKGTTLPVPSKALSQLQIGKVSGASAPGGDSADLFAGWMAEICLYASVLRQDQMQLIEGPNLKSYYFNSIPPLTQRLKTKLPQVEPRSAWQYKPSQNAAEAKNVADGNVTSRWGTKARQSPGQWFQVELPSEEMIAGLAMDAQAAPADYPRRFHIEVSADGRDWAKVHEAEGHSALIEIVFETPRQGRFIRITQDSSTSSNDWNLYELVIFKK